MAAAADVVFVMAYDMQSQVYGRCVAQANAPLEMVRWGLEQYLAMGVPAAKMVLGVPWYGYTYPCEGHPPPDVDFCVLPSTPFRNVSCSDAAGKEIGAPHSPEREREREDRVDRTGGGKTPAFKPPPHATR
jgi:di-N-acetylchitobiase